MRVGFVLPNTEGMSEGGTIARLARHAETLGYDSLWVVLDEPFPVSAWPEYQGFDGSLPEPDQPIWYPFDSLAVAAAHTERVRLGISLRNVPFYSPLMVARSLAALDVLSGGRSQVGFGLGWSVAEFDKVQSALTSPSSPASEFLRVLKAIWSGRETRFQGDFYLIPRLPTGSLPVQRPHPPISLIALAPPAVERPKVLLDGGDRIPLPAATGPVIETLQEVSHAAAHDGEGLEVSIRVLAALTDERLRGNRAPFHGSFEQVRADLAMALEVGVTEILFDLGLPRNRQSIGHVLADMTRLRELVPESARRARIEREMVTAAA